MELVKGIGELSHSVSHPVITIGNFDGVHLGHQKIIQFAVDKARERGGQAVAYTFRPHPQVALRPAARVQLLSTYDEKIQILEKLGIDLTIEEPFSREFSETEPSEFFSDILLHRLSVELVVVGYDFAFGRERHGHLEALRKFCHDSGVELFVVPPQRAGGDVVSSSKIREHLLAGRIQDANRLLGRPFSYQGVVVKGEGRGHQLGFPTANLKIENKLVLPYGVYVTWALHRNQLHPSVTNVGIRPTFHAETEKVEPLVETFLLDLAEDLYGDSIEVQFISKLRDEKKFNGVDELKLQMTQDVAEARRVLQAAGR